MKHSYSYLIPVLLSVFSCATVDVGDKGGDYRKEIRELNRQLLLKPNDPATQRDLGILYFKTKQYYAARLHLYRSHAQAADDARAVFFYGMTLEYLGDTQGALRVYANYPDLSSQYRKLIEGRYRTLTKELLQRQFQALIVDEQKLGTEKIVPNAIAVFPLRYQGTDPAYEPLGLGFSEMVLVDLGQVKSLQVVERIRIETLLQELKFGRSNSVDQATAPRLGKLLGAGRLVSGSYDLSKAKSLTINVASWDAIKRETPKITTASDELESLFKLEKDMVFSILDMLAITLTPKEREAIQRFPTKNLKAFMLYCIGLEREGAGDFKAAGEFFRQATSLDPGFVTAKAKADAAEALTIAGGPKEKALAAAKTLEPGDQTAARPAAPPNELIGTRLRNLGNGVGSNFYPGQDDRSGAEDAARFGLVGAGVGLPPPPPPR